MDTASTRPPDRGFGRCPVFDEPHGRGVHLLRCRGGRGACVQACTVLPARLWVDEPVLYGGWGGLHGAVFMPPARRDRPESSSICAKVPTMPHSGIDHYGTHRQCRIPAPARLISDFTCILDIGYLSPPSLPRCTVVWKKPQTLVQYRYSLRPTSPMPSRTIPALRSAQDSHAPFIAARRSSHKQARCQDAWHINSRLLR